MLTLATMCLMSLGAVSVASLPMFPQNELHQLMDPRMRLSPAAGPVKPQSPADTPKLGAFLDGMSHHKPTHFAFGKKPGKSVAPDNGIAGTNIQLDLSILHNMLRHQGASRSPTRMFSMGKLQNIGRK
jgi:hypothetical protein